MKNYVFKGALLGMMVAAFSTANAFAQNTDIQDEKKKAEGQFHAPRFELESLRGKIKVEGKKDKAIVYMKTDDGRTIVLTDDRFGKREELSDEQKAALKEKHEKKIEELKVKKESIAKNNESGKPTDGTMPGPQGKKQPPKNFGPHASMQQLKEANGKTITIHGQLNKDSNVFIVFEVGEKNKGKKPSKDEVSNTQAITDGFAK